MTDHSLTLNTWQRNRLANFVAEHPGWTLEEHETAARVVDRYLVRAGLVSLVDQRVIRRDENGRLWPLT
ncbi:hypothetical protein [Streptomyces spinosisporus]|uniref:DUF2087 domain-containing protein n=1 Tax=Streptomyces spinosisporus TaxID=2927582 RepID=A0ABS9X820_9ACTN|nr:hypothetical protein [Streptomyces spinosisporus]MCI3238208.1 hypothetical protein [Streptomyces spinosisporus]